MLIETLGNIDETIVYSKNKFDFLTNFVMVKKSNPDVSKFMDFKEVSFFINEPIKKNLILYRLLTNDEDLDPFSSKLGFFIKLENKIEIVYFDPVFIENDINNLSISLPEDEFKYKVQQVGFFTKELIEDTIIFEESFSIDLSIDEAKKQNDALLAESLLKLENEKIFDKSYLRRKKRNSALKNNTEAESYFSMGNKRIEKKKEEGDNLKITGSNSGFVSRLVHKKKDKNTNGNSSLNMFR